MTDPIEYDALTTVEPINCSMPRDSELLLPKGRSFKTTQAIA